MARVFITDSLLTTLMCAPRSVYSWDIVATRAGDKLFFDKRDGSNLDLLTVAETAPDPLPEDKDAINGVQQLSLEATAINQNFSQQVLRSQPVPHARQRLLCRRSGWPTAMLQLLLTVLPCEDVGLLLHMRGTHR